ncbi:MAG: hypothetical protein E7513_03155 [Ruminococcaceae bacterium]|nr:hypothetical protein [Oscillospiraceae bacterium]
MTDYEKMSNKEFAFSLLGKMNNAGALTDSVLNILTNADECQRRFCCSSGFAVLMEVPSDCSDAELKKLCYFGDKRRYYQDRFVVGKCTFVVENHWYGPNKSNADNRTPFLNWVNSIL